MRGKTLLRSIGVSQVGDSITTNRENSDIHFNPDRRLTGDEQVVFRSAIPDFTKSIELMPISRAYYYRAVAYDYLFERDNAIADYIRAIELNPNFADALARRGRLYLYSTQNKAQGFDDINNALSVNPNLLFSGYFCEVMGDTYFELGEFLKAIKSYDQSLLRFPPSRSYVYLYRGVSYYRLGNYDKAIADLTESIRLDPSSTLPFAVRGHAYNDKGEPDRAIADYESSLRIDPNLNNIRDALVTRLHLRGLKYGNDRDYDRAIADFETALRHDPNNTDIKVLLVISLNRRGVVYYNNGNLDRAITDFEAALRSDPNNADARNNLEVARRERGR